MECEFQHKKEIFDRFTSKIALLHYHNNRFDASFSYKKPFCNCVPFCILIRAIKLYNKALTANQPECKSFTSHQLQCSFDPKRWVINDQKAIDCARHSSEFFSQLIISLPVLEALFPISSSNSKQYPFLEEVWEETSKLIINTSYDELLHKQLLQESHDIAYEYITKLGPI